MALDILTRVRDRIHERRERKRNVVDVFKAEQHLDELRQQCEERKALLAGWIKAHSEHFGKIEALNLRGVQAEKLLPPHIVVDQLFDCLYEFNCAKRKLDELNLVIEAVDGFEEKDCRKTYAESLHRRAIVFGYDGVLEGVHVRSNELLVRLERLFPQVFVPEFGPSREFLDKQFRSAANRSAAIDVRQNFNAQDPKR